MLTAYSFQEYNEKIHDAEKIKGGALFEKEVDIAHRFTMKHQEKDQQSQSCPICKSVNKDLFFEKWGIAYCRCSRCFSVFACVSSEATSEYESSSELTEFYQSEEYQKNGLEKREERWEEILDWISFRTYRYKKKNKDLRITDIGNRWHIFRKKIIDSELCGEYRLLPSFCEKEEMDGKADIVMAFDCFQRKSTPYPFLTACHRFLKDDGLLFMGIKAGSGMDIILLKEKNRNVFPFEHILMPSKEGIMEMLEQSGFELLELITPGMFDVEYLKEHVSELPEENILMHYLLQNCRKETESDLQRFIQKAGLSSYAQVVARKKNEEV